MKVKLFFNFVPSTIRTTHFVWMLYFYDEWFRVLECFTVSKFEYVSMFAVFLPMILEVFYHYFILVKFYCHVINIAYYYNSVK